MNLSASASPVPNQSFHKALELSSKQLDGDSIEGPEKTEVFEVYAENKTPAAYRIFWCYYHPKQEGQNGSITVLAITPHP